MNLELMSPAGNLDSFLAAINGGADSIYLGLKKFNARRPAQNFTNNQLEKVINFAHQRNKKIYITLNIDLKSNELKEACEIIEFLDKLKIDGIIIKDPAILFILKTFYKNKISIHFSTQNAIESSLGVKFAELQGVNRIVLARELELDEIKKCVDTGKVEIEIFTEGSMCFSISGRCLMSSWVGGHSGNRGACTAPCRVIWSNREKQYPYFSMKDLSLIENLKELKEIGISALKIEGRLKTPIWVKTITSIYRNAIDNLTDIKNLESLSNDLKKYSAREKDKGHIKKHNNLIGKNEEWESYQKLEGDLEIPEKEFFNEINKITVDCENGLLKIIITVNDKTCNLEFIISPIPKKAAPVIIDNLTSFLNNGNIHGRKFEIQINNGEINTSSSFLNKVSNEIITEIRKLINKNEELPQLRNEILNFINPIKQDVKRKEILGDKPDKIIIFPDQIKYFTNIKNISEIIISLTTEIDIKLLKMLEKNCKIILSIPAVLFEKQAIKTNKLIDYFIENGFNNFEANSYTGIQCLSEKKCNKSLGYEFPVFNHLSAQYFYSLDYESVFVSPEADSSTYKALSSFTKGKIDCLVFAKLALFQSRVQSDYFINNAVFKDKFSELECFKIMDINYFISKKVFSLIGNNFKKENIYFDRLVSDLRFFNNPDKIFTQFTGNNFNFQETSSFNFNSKLL